MEPVFMVLSQSAATAACLAIDDKVSVQQVDYAKLRARLLADKQVLEWKGAAKPPKGAAGPAKLSGIVVDDDAAEFTGEWEKSGKLTALVGGGYRHDRNRDRGQKTAPPR
jgi:hypothetical protein